MVIEEHLYDYMVEARNQELTKETEERCRIHLLDTLVAIISGSTLVPGKIAFKTASQFGSKPECSLIGKAGKVGAFEAALANGMAAHADETDDSHLNGRFHPGCAVIPAAIAAGEISGSDSTFLLRAIALGYDIGARCNIALGIEDPSKIRLSTHCFGGLFGAAAAAGSLLAVTRNEVGALMSFSVQQASGLPYWNRDPDHIEKAFVFGGKGARDGLYSAIFAKCGMTSPADPFTGERGFLSCFGENPDPKKLVEGLGNLYQINQASIKKWCVGSPIQSVLDGLETILKNHKIDLREIEEIFIEMPSDRIHIVDNASISTICLQHLAALMLVSGDCSFAEAHDESLMRDPKIMSVRKKITIIKSDELARAKPERQSVVSIRMASGHEYNHHTRVVHGTPQKPMTTDDVAKKSQSVLSAISNHDFSQLIDTCLKKKKFSIKEVLDSCILE